MPKPKPAQPPDAPDVRIIAGVSIPVTHELVPVGKVQLDGDNPRIRFLTQHGNGSAPLNEEALMKLIREQPGYDSLQRAIRKNGGLEEPILIRADGRVVEGNTRLTVYKTLLAAPARRNDPQWQRIAVLRLPEDVPEHLIAMMMASYHIGGKEKWKALAKAEHVKYLKETHNLSVEQITDCTRLTPAEVQQLLDAYDYFIEELLPKLPKGQGVDELSDKFSYALEFIRSRKLRDIRKDPKHRSTVAKLIVKGKLKKGAQVRELHKILNDKEASKVIKKEGFEAAKKLRGETDPTVDSQIFGAMVRLTKSLKKMRQQDVRRLQTQDEAQRIVRDLVDAIALVARLANVDLGAGVA